MKRKNLELLCFVVGMIYCGGAVYYYNTNHGSIDNIINMITILSFGFTFLIFAYSLLESNVSEDQNIEINDKLDKINEKLDKTLHDNSVDELIKEAIQNQKLFKLGLISCVEYRSRKKKLKNKYKKMSNEK